MRTGIRCGNAHVETIHITGQTKAGTLCGRKPAKWAHSPRPLEEASKIAKNACYKVCAGCEKRVTESRKACAQCGREVEPQRRIYAIPTCYTCLPPPPPLPGREELHSAKPSR